MSSRKYQQDLFSSQWVLIGLALVLIVWGGVIALGAQLQGRSGWRSTMILAVMVVFTACWLAAVRQRGRSTRK